MMRRAFLFVLIALLASSCLVAQTNQMRVNKLMVKQSPWVDVRSYGAKGDGATDDSPAIQAALTYAASVGASVKIPASATPYILANPINLPSGERASVVIEGEGVTTTDGYLTGMGFGSVLKCTTTSDCIVVNSTHGYPDASYVFKNLTIIGPDTYSPRTTTSGNGIAFDGDSSTRLLMENVSISLFYGSGKAGISINSTYYATLTKVNITHCDIGLKLANASNVFQGDNIALRLNQSYGMYIDGSSGGWVHGVFESNEKTGLRFAGDSSINWHFDTCWFENNNTTSTAGESAIVIKPDSASASVVRDILFTNPTINIGSGLTAPCAAPILYGSDSTHMVRGIRFLGGYWAGLAAAGQIAHLHGNVLCTNFEFLESTLTPSNITTYTVSGITPAYTTMNSGYVKQYNLQQSNIALDSTLIDSYAALNLGGRIYHADASAANDTTTTIITSHVGDDTTLGPLLFSISAHPSATDSSRFSRIVSGDGNGYRPLVLDGNALIGAPTDILQVNGAVYIAGSVTSKGVAYSALGSVVNGAFKWCTDCTVGATKDTACTSGGSGAWAFGSNESWKCPF